MRSACGVVAQRQTARAGKLHPIRAKRLKELPAGGAARQDLGRATTRARWLDPIDRSRTARQVGSRRACGGEFFATCRSLARVRRAPADQGSRGVGGRRRTRSAAVPAVTSIRRWPTNHRRSDSGVPGRTLWRTERAGMNDTFIRRSNRGGLGLGWLGLGLRRSHYGFVVVDPIECDDALGASQ
jgi:hypothetical protein